MSLTQKVCVEGERKRKQNHPQLSVYHPTKNEVTPIYSVGGVWQHTDTQTHTQTGYGGFRIDICLY